MRHAQVTPDQCSPRAEPSQGWAFPAEGRGELGYTGWGGRGHSLQVPEGRGARPGQLGRGLRHCRRLPCARGVPPPGTRRRAHPSAPRTRGRGSGRERGVPGQTKGPTAVAAPERESGRGPGRPQRGPVTRARAPRPSEPAGG